MYKDYRATPEYEIALLEDLVTGSGYPLIERCFGHSEKGTRG